MSNRFTEEEISNLHLLGRLLGQTRRFATSNLNKAGKNHLFMTLDAAHNIPAALLTPSAYEITDDVEHLRMLLDEMDDPNFIDSTINPIIF
jgi:hypothetical protein